jgi:hypothetical protein
VESASSKGEDKDGNRSSAAGNLSLVGEDGVIITTGTVVDPDRGRWINELRNCIEGPDGKIL